MPSADIELGGITFSVVSEREISWGTQDSSYLPFLVISSQEGALSFPVRLDFSAMPDTSGFPTVFDVGDMWSLFTDGNAFVIVQTAAESGPPSWAIQFSRKASDITVFSARPDWEVLESNPFSYPVDQLLLIFLMAWHKGALIHSAGGVLGGLGYLFAGVSGAGKSTLSRCLIERGYEMLSDDRMIVRKMDGEFRAFGTPWAGEADIAGRGNLPLGGIFFLCQSRENKVRDLNPSRAAERLMPVTSIPFFDRETTNDILSFCEDLVTHIPAYELCFRPGAEIVDLLEEFLTKR